MTDETAPFPVPDEQAKKPRRRRGGARHKKQHPAAQEEPRRSLEAVAAAPPMPLQPPLLSAPASMAVTPGPPVRTSIEQRLGIFIDFENIALGVRDA
jgi:hypothetical protein